MAGPARGPEEGPSDPSWSPRAAPGERRRAARNGTINHFDLIFFNPLNLFSSRFKNQPLLGGLCRFNPPLRS
ncbi:hypothetical protein Mhar_1083 [Methanothrix harundinacea 6Ac]|uniref:Uncharacterized protein n=1 Tax=Methanothrix harundinacea (strain 6Ac) TaxID=1110509 RepID=G7WMF6_METH6|nr:hypothetical protein Mhar_1083 [Methanothrix harundinacea 6Ac]